MKEFESLADEQPTMGGRSVPGGLGPIALAAAVGAGVALLFTTDAGRETRDQVARRIRSLELGDRVERLGSAASEQWSHARKRRRKRGSRRGRPILHREVHHDNGALYATLGTVAGAALAALLTPQGGRETREWLGNTFDDLRSNASLRWQEHRARRDAPTTPADLEAERLNGSEV